MGVWDQMLNEDIVFPQNKTKQNMTLLSFNVWYIVYCAIIVEMGCYLFCNPQILFVFTFYTHPKLETGM